MTIAVLAVVAWLGITLSGAGAALVVTWLGDLACEAEVGDSNYGHMEWSTVPPGPRCVWTPDVNGFAATAGPSPIWSVWLVTVVALGIVAWRKLFAAVAAAGSLDRSGGSAPCR